VANVRIRSDVISPVHFRVSPDVALGPEPTARKLRGFGT
jgi:hypothetical protein